MSESVEQRARATAHELLGPTYCAAGVCERVCDRLTAALVEHEAALAGARAESRARSLGLETVRLRAEKAERERDAAHASGLSEGRAESAALLERAAKLLGWLMTVAADASPLSDAAAWIVDYRAAVTRGTR